MPTRRVRLAAVGLALILSVAGCSSQQVADQDKKVEAEPEAEEVYTLPDGTEVKGEAAMWLKEATQQLIADEAPPGDEEDARRALGDILVTPELPDRFHLVDIRVEPTTKHVIMSWAAPASKEWVALKLSPSYVDVTYRGKAQCITVKQGDVQISDIPSWATGRCVANIQTPQAYAHLFMLNVPANEADVIVASVRDRLFAEMEEKEHG